MRALWANLLIASSLLLTPLPSFSQVNPSALLQEAQAAQEGGKFVLAEKLLRQLSEQFPSPEAYYLLGNALHSQLKIAEALNAYQQALQLAPNYIPALMNSGLTLIELESFEDAISRFQRIIELPDEISVPASTHTLAHYNLGIIYKRQGKSDEALQEVERALKINPEFAPAQKLWQQLQKSGASMIY